MFSERLQPTGNDLVDSLRDLQVFLDSIDDIDKKIVTLKQGIHIIKAADLLGGQFMVSTMQTFGHNLDESPDNYTLFESGLTFCADLDAFGYLKDDGIPVDTLTLDFTNPDVFEAISDEQAHKRFRALKLQVPVLAIDTCMSMAA
jgi:hypothetical protein